MEKTKTTTSLGRLLVLAGLALTTLGLAQGRTPKPPLVACEAGKNVACVVLATRPGDLVGVWKQTIGADFAPPDGMGYVRYHSDGTYALGATPEGTKTVTPPFPAGRVRFDGALMTIETPASPLPECRTGVYEVRVIRFGAQPVGLHYTLVQDTCAGRVSDLSQVLPYIGPDN